MPVATIDDVRNHDGLLIDTRTATASPAAARTLTSRRHIPGAVNVPERLSHNDGLRTWKSAGEIREVLFDAGLTPDNVQGAIIYLVPVTTPPSPWPPWKTLASPACATMSVAGPSGLPTPQPRRARRPPHRQRLIAPVRPRFAPSASRVRAPSAEGLLVPTTIVG